MTSSMLAGERRWASARRGGMTVLGKVAVPKPINLPSQRLENHGLDPNVEIVPKGTLSWGSRTSSSTSNAWGSSALSPNADGGTSSPSHLRSRPSSGGGTRPSTAGSDKTQEPTSSAWGTTSRPSSASGPLSSNKAPPTLVRPRSAETRPGSSQLSRFAEPVSEHPAAWGATATAERLGVGSSKNEVFSLTSGDFPTLGSDVSGKTTESQAWSCIDHGSRSRPSSASGKVSQSLEKTTASHLDAKGGPVDAWKSDSHSAEDGPQHVHHQYLGPNVPPQHFDTWHGPPPMNAPAGLWYRGPPGGPPYGAPVPPGGFPIEPFPYFRPQIPPPAIANSQPPGPGPRGHHPRGGDIYRPQMADAYIRPNIPFRPGFYPGPVAFDGYYGPPPMGYCNSNEREIPLMGMPPGPPVYNRYSGPNTPDPSNTYARIGGESAHPDAKGPYRVLLKHDPREEGDTWESSAHTNGPYPDRNFQRSLQKHERGGELDGEKELYSRRTTGNGNCYPRGYDDRGGDSLDNTKTNNSSEGIVNTKKDSSLIQKIEGLNAKIRASDGREVPHVSPEEDMNKVTDSISEGKGAFMSSERTHTSGTNGNKGGQSTATLSRRPYQSVQTNNDQGKARFASHDDGWRRRPIAVEPSTVASATCLESAANVPACDLGPQVEAIEQALADISMSGEKESLSELHDSADTQAQRAKMKELARQRALQLQKEEEERIKQQKAKALAKLEELNRRMQAGDASSQKTEKVALFPDVTKQDLEVSSPPLEQVVSTVKPQAQSATVAVHCEVIDASEPTSHKDSVHINPSVKLEFGTANFVQSYIAIPQPQPLQTKKDSSSVATAHGKGTGQSSDGGVAKHKRTSYKQRPNMTPKDMNEKSVMVSATELSKGYNDVDVPLTEAREVVSSAASNIINSAKVAVESSTQQRRKGNRINKNKQKLDAPLPAPNDSQYEKLSTSQLVLDDSSAQAATGGDNVVQPSGQSSPLPMEEGHGRGFSQWKPQHPRRMQRNQHLNTHGEKFHGGGDAVVWAPVRSHSKTEDAAEASQKTISDSVGSLKSDNVVQSNSKSKRAEMERYVPKPVAKELAQHGTTQLPPGSSHGPNGTAGKADTEGFTVESSDGDGKHNNNKQGKAHGVWRQRASTEGLDTTKNAFKPMKSESKSEFDDGWTMPDECEALRTTIPVVKDEETLGKGKRNPPKGHRSSGHGTKNSSGEIQQTHAQPGAPEIDGRAVAKENRVMGNRTPHHWQPKPHLPSANNQQEGVSNEVQNVTMEGNRGNRRDYNHDKVSVQEVPERKPASFRDRPYSPNQGPVVKVESDASAESSESMQEQNSTGLRRNVNQNNRSGRAQEPFGDFSSVKDNRQHNTSSGRERRRNNMHYEYQPVGAADGSHHVGQRYRERGQVQSKRGGGNFHGRQGGSVRVNVIYE